MPNIRFLITSSIFSQTASASLMRAHAKGLGSKATFVCYCIPNNEVEQMDGLSGSTISYRYPSFLRKVITEKWINRLSGTLGLIVDFAVHQLSSNDTLILHSSSALVIFCLSSIAKLKKKTVSIYRTEIPHRPTYNLILRLATKLTYINVSIMIVETNRMKEYYKKHVCPKAIVHVLYSVVDCEDVLNAKRKDIGREYFAYCGLISAEHKDGLLTIISAFSIIAKRYKTISLVIAGACSSIEYMEKIRSLIFDCGLEERVLLTGRLSRSDYASYLKGASLLVNGKSKDSHNSYGFSSKIVEYLYSGNPVLMTRSDEYSDILCEEEAIFIDESRADDYINKFDFVLSNPDRARTIGSNGREKALALFNYRKMASELLEIALFESRMNNI